MKRYFSFQLFKDGFRQLKLFGIFGIIIIGLVSVFAPINVMLSEKENQYIEPINGMDINVLLMLCTFVMAPVFVLYLFSFLNKRNTSDFYHSIPVKRTCIYISYMASIIAWITFIIVINLAVSYVLYSTLTSCTMYNRTILTYVLNVWIGSLYSAVTISLAMCISGTALTNILVSGIILFLPRIYIYIITICICDQPYLSVKHFMPILTPSYDIIFGTFASLLDFGDGFSFYRLSSSIYTFVLAVIFFLLAIYLFSKRKSETAGCAAPSKRLQSVYRVLVAFVICLFPIVGIHDMYISYYKETPSPSDILFLVIFYVIAILVYFAYEIITTKKFRTLPKTLPGLGVLVLLNIFSICIIQSGVTISKHFTPTADKIDYVYIEGVDVYSFLDSDNQTEYYSYIQSKIKLDDLPIKEIVSKRLKEAVDSEMEFSNYDERFDYYTIKIKSGAKTCYRRIPLTSKDLTTIHQTLESDKEYQNKFVNLPNYNSMGTSFYIDDGMGDIKITAGQKKTLYEKIQQEIKDFGYEGWYERYNYMHMDSDFELDFNHYVYIYTYVGTVNCVINFPLELLPKSYLLYAKMMTNDKTIAAGNAFLSDPFQYPYASWHISILDLQTLQNYTNHFYYDNYEEEDSEDNEESGDVSMSSAEKAYLKASKEAEAQVIETLKDFTKDNNYEDYENSRYIVFIDLNTDSNNSCSIFIPIKGNTNIDNIKKCFDYYNKNEQDDYYY